MELQALYQVATTVWVTCSYNGSTLGIAVLQLHQAFAAHAWVWLIIGSSLGKAFWKKLKVILFYFRHVFEHKLMMCLKS